MGLYDYYHFGATLLRLGKLEEAKAMFEKELKIYASFADTYYYLGLIYEKMGDRNLAKKNFRLAYEKYTKTGYHRSDPYCILPDQVFLSEISQKLD